jgi:hypothetical protein
MVPVLPWRFANAAAGQRLDQQDCLVWHEIPGSQGFWDQGKSYRYLHTSRSAVTCTALPLRLTEATFCLFPKKYQRLLSQIISLGADTHSRVLEQSFRCVWLKLGQAVRRMNTFLRTWQDFSFPYLVHPSWSSLYQKKQKIKKLSGDYAILAWRNTHAIRKTTRNPVRNPPRSSCKKTIGGSGQTGI